MAVIYYIPNVRDTIRIAIHNCIIEKSRSPYPPPNLETNLKSEFHRTFYALFFKQTSSTSSLKQRYVFFVFTLKYQFNSDCTQIYNKANGFGFFPTLTKIHQKSHTL